MDGNGKTITATTMMMFSCIRFLATLLWALLQLTQSFSSSAPTSSTSTSGVVVDGLLQQARNFLDKREDPEGCMGVLGQIYAQDPSAPGLFKLFEQCLSLKIEQNPDNKQDRWGLASLLLDQERYDEAVPQLRYLTTRSSGGAIKERAASMLFRTNVAIAQWDRVEEEG